MKIEGPNRTSGAKGASKTGGAKSTGDAAFSSLVSEAGGAGEPSAAASSSAIAQIDALLSLQQADDAMSDEAKKRASQHANMLLDQLEQVRIGILTGGISGSALVQLDRAIADKRPAVMDPHLNDILDEIDLRVKVELAKLGRF